MKTLIFLISFALFLEEKNPEQLVKTTSLQEAVEKELIDLQIFGNANSPHYSQPIRLVIRNLTTQPYNIEIPNGQQFISLNESVQNMIVVKTEQIALQAKQQKSQTLFAMCTQKNNVGPSHNEAYSLGPLASSPLIDVSQKIQEKEEYNTIGQYSVWSISNNLSLDQIAGFDEESAIEMQQFISKLTGREIPEKDTTDYLTNYTRQLPAVRKVSGGFEYGLIKTSAVTIGLFNEQNIIVRELLNKENMPRGDHELKFEFDMAAYTDPVYFVRLIIDGEIKLSYKLES